MTQLEIALILVFATAVIKGLVIPDWPSAALTFITATIFVYERYQSAKEAANPLVDLNPLKAQIQALDDRYEALENKQLEANKIVEETKRILTTANVGMAFRPRAIKKD